MGGIDMVKIEEIKLDIWREYVPMYNATRYCLTIKTLNDDGSRYSFIPVLTYKGDWNDHLNYECRAMNEAYDGDKAELKKIGTKILQEFHILTEKYYCTGEMAERMQDIGSCLFRGIIR